MWNQNYEAHAARMRERATRLQTLLAHKQLANERQERGRRKGLEKAAAENRAHGESLRSSVIEVQVREPAKRLRNIQGRIEANYPVCPACPGALSINTIRAGFANGIQRYRCLLCRRTFSGAKVVIRLEPFDYQMICYHCGSDKAERLGRGLNVTRTGRMGFCGSCNRKFVQGGLKDLQKYHLLLTRRIIDARLPPDVEAEVLQMASEDVLTGKGYCWSVELRIKEAWRNVRGEYGQMGSDHPVFRREQGQHAYAD